MMIPKDVDMATWAASLIVDFPHDDIPLYLPLDKDDKKYWKGWGSSLIQETSFTNNGAPSPGDFTEPLEWAQAVFRSMVNF